MPFVQTKIAQYFTNSLNKDFGTNIAIDEVAISVFGGVKFKKVLIRDHHKDTLIYSNRISTTILESKKLLNGDLIFDGLDLQGLIFNLKTYKNEKESNLDKFVEAFETGKPSTRKFLLKANKIQIFDGRFILTDENREIPKDLDFTKLNAYVTDFLIFGPDVTTSIHKMSFLDFRGLYVKNLSSKFSYSKKNIKLKNLDLLTKESTLNGDVALNYKIEDFLNFTDKVQFDIKLNSASIASNDIRHFYKELGKNQHFYVRTSIKGTLNNLKLQKLKLIDNRKTEIIGDINFKNLFAKKGQKFFMYAEFDKLTSTYEDLVVILPNVLGNKLPTSLRKLGRFSASGTSSVSTTVVEADFAMITALGNVTSNLAIQNIDEIDKASYLGNVILENFDIGTLLERKELGRVSMNIDVDGKGFKQKYLDTGIKGDISKIDFNNYSYSNIVVDGALKSPKYKGHISINDPNLNMNFDGLLDLSNVDSRYDFHINVENADLNKLKILKDSVSVFKGDVVVQATGNNIENFQGNVYINKTSYKNAKETYNFDDFTINSAFDQNKIRTITVNSPDIVEGEIIGKFEFNQLENLVKNSLGSLYTNFKPHKVKKGQFLKFNFSIYNKIIEIFFPEISIGTNTIVKGNMNSDNQEFKLNFNSPQIIASANTFDNISVSVDNKNPLYNAYIELDSIKTKYYTIRDFSLINVTMKDTLYFRSEFKGGKNAEDYYNLNLYHTINKDNNNVVGISKSEVKFKDYLWYLNENETPDNQIVFDKSFKNFNIDNIILSHENQSISLAGIFKDTSFKDLKLSFKDVDLNQITPTNDKLILEGNINGEVSFKQNKNVYQPTASIVIDNLNVNKTDLGILNFDIEGDENLEKFTINSNLENKYLESFNADGSFQVINKETILDLKLKFDKFNIATLNSLGGEVLSNIRGSVSGNAVIEGNLKKPAINGRLFLDKGGVTIPYLNVDYGLSTNTIIDLTDERFLFRNNTLTDTKYGTKGNLNGYIEHNNFGDWKLDLAVNSKRLLALDTKDSEDAAYYGTAFIDGTATIKGPTNSLFIKVDAKSEKGTAVKIPINNAESVSDNIFLHFVTEKEKYNLKNGIIDNTRNYNGLELEFDFDITPDAEVEVILDRNTGHGMKGKGFGSLLFKINTLGKFNMWGDYQAYEGTYNFRYGGLIDKKFEVKKGGSITWEGNPMRAQLNLEAVYKTSANPAVLLENSSFNTKVPVEVIIGVRGDLTSPEPDFNIEFPTVSTVLKSEIQYKLNDKDVRQTQALYLLSSGAFLSPEGVSQSDFSGSLFETASSILGGIIQSDDDKFKVGLNFIGADRRVGKETDGRFVATISSKINDRVTINGKLGVPFGGINQSAVVGDVEVLFRVNEDGTLNLRLFNKENDINYVGQGIGYTQGLGVSYAVDFDSFKEFVNKIFKNLKFDKVTTPASEDQDSNLSPEYINFQRSKKNNSEKIKKNQEGLIPDEN
ncbi:MAG: translocation/assembly module TamB [Flavobacterium sp.]|uniref:translocation/assembly module TamB domain-containing protein n=1 Tax=Flavobacterium sp. TaxID=239 RepID=UPI001B43BA68|nr:translocation/assembly module TamB domain-containing protein [Flavobacterium sp.]MBP6147038.1 translocation/assembly module TamB [Flavobacterium sp.]MBP7183193.1 translocation/assembly module TamB [Flavobacterium sp.]MBP7318462.1 translocation/assembly module TamB [Flavobacterium sp.]MBP8887233.1 translocation/assembly module TamB [Flavobacterium sp.]